MRRLSYFALHQHVSRMISFLYGTHLTCLFGIMADRRVISCSTVISLMLTTHLLISSARDGQYYKFGPQYSCLYLGAPGTTAEPGRVFILRLLLPISSAVPKRRTNRAFMNGRVPYDVSGLCSFQIRSYLAMSILILAHLGPP